MVYDELVRGKCRGRACRQAGTMTLGGGRGASKDHQFAKEEHEALHNRGT